MRKQSTKPMSQIFVAALVAACGSWLVACSSPSVGQVHGCPEAAGVISASSVYYRKFEGLRSMCEASPVAAESDAHARKPVPAGSDSVLQRGALGSGIPWSVDGDAPSGGSSVSASVFPPVDGVGSGVGRRALMLAPLVDQVAARYGLDPLLIHAIAYVESRHVSTAKSRAGAVGLMQVMPATARRFGVAETKDLNNAAVNLDVASQYLASLFRVYGTDLRLVLAAYNAGEGAVKRHGRQVPPYRETRAYVRDVQAQYGRLKAVRQDELSPSLGRVMSTRAGDLASHGEIL